MRGFRRAAFILTIIATVLAVPGIAVAGTISLAWDPVPDADLAGYNVYYGTAPNSYGPPVDVGNVTSTTLSGLDACTTWHVAVKAYDSGGLESASFSQEIVGLPRPVVGSLSPSSGEQGSSQTITLTGESFASGATVEFSGSGIAVSNVQFVSCTELQVSVDIASNAPAGARTVTVVNTDNTFGEATGAFTVTANAAPSVSSASPSNGTTGVDVDVQPTVTFNEAMDAASVTASTVQLLDGSGQPVAQAAGSPALSGNGLTATITPASDLAWESTFRIRVAGGAGGVQDAGGASMAADFQQSTGFTTTTQPDTSGPSVQSTSPANGATDVPVGSNAQVVFDEAVDPASVTPGTVLLIDASGQAVPQAAGSPSVSGDGLTVTVDPASDLAENATYRIRVVGGAGGVTDQSGNPVASTFEQGTGFTIENLPPAAVAGARRTDVR